MNPSAARLLTVVALASGISCGSALADTVTGSLIFPSDSTNWYDGLHNGGNSVGYDNAGGPTVTLHAGVATFGYNDLFTNIITAAFTPGQLDIADDVMLGSNGWTQTFTASQGFFTGLLLTNTDTFSPDLTFHLDPTDTTLTVTWDGTLTPGTYDAVFTFSSSSPVPGPIVGAGLPGLVFAFGGMLTWRCRKRAMA
jgi:hypothetical protein